MYKNAAVFRRYCMVSDFDKVYGLCARIGNERCSNGMAASFWEYAQTFGSFEYAFSHRIGLWEAGGSVVAVAAYEIEPGEAYFAVDPEFRYLADELIAYAEASLCDADGRVTLCFSDAQTEMRDAAKRRGYTVTGAYPEKMYRFEKGFPDRPLPDGFRFLDNAREPIDYGKLDTCLHYGFDHDGEPDGDTDFRIHMHVTPHFDPRLPVIVIDESNGQYAAYANAFMDTAGGYAYLEPLCTQPRYRCKGLAAAVISEMSRRVVPMGARYLTGGSDGFYTAVGYEVAYHNEYWTKQTDRVSGNEE